MLIAEKLAGLPPDECDSFRRTLTKRSMSKKDKAAQELKELKIKFVDGCVTNGLEKEKAEDLFAKMKFFSGYAFNKSLHEDTLVSTYTQDGTFIADTPLHAVEAGSFVRGRTEQTNEPCYVRVVANHDHGTLPLFRVELESGETIECTLDHKFRTTCGRMLPLWQITKEDLGIVTSYMSECCDVDEQMLVFEWDSIHRLFDDLCAWRDKNGRVVLVSD